MAKKISEPKVDRRKFMAGVAVAGAAGAVSAPQPAKAAAQRAPAAMRPTAAEQAAETRGAPQAPAHGHGTGRPGSDFMVDVIKSLNIDYVATNPASSCRGIHESFINYGRNTKPEMLTVMHEETGGRAQPWRTAISRSPASRCWGSITAPSGCSTRRWRSTTPGATASR
jgi:hypothetical protein